MKVKWFDIWFEDKQMMVEVMHRNMSADLDAGYNPLGDSITRQRHMIKNYIQDYNNQMDKFKEMTEQQVQHWCYYDLKKRGVIA